MHMLTDYNVTVNQCLQVIHNNTLNQFDTRLIKQLAIVGLNISVVLVLLLLFIVLHHRT